MFQILFFELMLPKLLKYMHFPPMVLLVTLARLAVKLIKGYISLQLPCILEICQIHETYHHNYAQANENWIYCRSWWVSFAKIFSRLFMQLQPYP